MVKTFTFPRLQSDVELSFDYSVGTGSSKSGNNWTYDNALVTLSGDVDHSTGKLENCNWQTYTSPLTLTGTGETATITMTVALQVNTELVGQLGFLIDNISVTGAYDRNSMVSGTQGASTHDFSSLITSESVSIEPFRFSIVDKGSDGQPTYIHQLEVGTGNDNNVPDWNEAMGGANLYKINADNSLEFIGSGIILSQSILFEKENLIVVPEGGSSIYVIKPWLKETLNSALDNKTLSFKIESAGIVASNGSSFKAVSSSAQSDKYIIRIIATELRFAQEPSLTTNKNIALPRQPIIIATDANGNIDSDFSGSVSVVSDPVGVDGSLSVNAVNGTASFANLKFADSGYYTLAFSSNNLTGVASSEIEVSNYEGINLSGTSYIGAVRFAGIDSYTSRGANGYELLIDQVAYLTTGLSYDIQVLFNVASGDGSLDLKAQIDYKDGRGFVDLVSFGSFSDVSNRVEKQTVTAPSNISGRFRLRIILTSGNKGEIEDYTVVISEGQWTGLAPQWDIRDNWTSGRIPSYTDDVTIPSKPTIGVFFPVINDNRDVNNVTIEKDARLTIKPGAKVTIHGDLKIEKPGGLVLENKAGHNGLASLITKGKVSGEANIKLTLPRDEWYYVSHPIKNAKSGIYDVFMPGEDLVNNDFKEFSHIAFHRNNKWYRVTGANVVLWNLEGMSVKYWPTNKSTHTLDYYGVLNNEPISRTYDKAGFYLFGNPYTSSIDWEAAQGWERPNIDGTIWYRTRINKAMAFVTYNREAAEGAKVTIYPDGMTDSDEKRLALIPPMQSVWIKANAPTTLTVDNRIRQHDTKELMLKSSSVASNADVIRITAENQYSRDVAVLYFWEKSHDTLDRGDSEKQFNEGDLVPEVYTLVEGKALAINGLSSLNSNSTSIPISVKNQIAGEVTLSFDLSKFSREYALYLEDKVTGNHSNLLLDNNYTYIVTKTGAVNDRFVLHLHKITTGIEDVILDQGDDASKLISIRSLSDKVLVSVSAELVQTEHGVIEVYAIDGRKISEIPAVSSRTFLILPQEKGVYIVRAIFGKHIKSERVINSQR
jgi:hypothetical protein